MADVVDIAEQRSTRKAEDSVPKFGDIFLQSRPGFVGWAIRRIEKRIFKTSGQFSHGGIIMTDTLLVDSTYIPFKVNGVSVRKRADVFKGTSVMIGRIWPEVRDEDLHRAWNSVVAPALEDDVKYDFKVLTSVGRSHRYDRLFCTDLVWEFVKEALRKNLDVPLFRRVCPTPDEIAFMVDPIRFSCPSAREIYQGILKRKPVERGFLA